MDLKFIVCHQALRDIGTAPEHYALRAGTLGRSGEGRTASLLCLTGPPAESAGALARCPRGAGPATMAGSEGGEAIVGLTIILLCWAYTRAAGNGHGTNSRRWSVAH
jgi:hypothetical protein